MNASCSNIRLNDGPKIKLVKSFNLVGAGLSFVCCLVIRGSTGVLVLFRYFRGMVWHPSDLQVSQYVAVVESPYLIHHRSYL